MAKTSIQYIKEAAKKLVDSKLQRLGAAKTQEIFKGVMQTVGLESMEEVYLFVAHFDLTCRDRTSNMDDLSNYFECSSLDMIEYIPALKSLERKGLLVRRRRREENIFKQDFAVSDTVMAAIIENQAVQISHIKVDEMQIDKYEFCKRIAEKVEDNDVITEDLIIFVDKLENSNSHLSFISELKKDVPVFSYDLLHERDYLYVYKSTDPEGDNAADDGSRAIGEYQGKGIVLFRIFRKDRNHDQESSYDQKKESGYGCKGYYLYAFLLSPYFHNYI